MCICLGASTLSGTAQEEVDFEHKLKAAYLYNFIQFTDWPDSDSKRDLIIGIDNVEGFGKYILQLEKQTKGNRSLRVVSIKDDSSIEDCDLLYFESESRQKVQRYITALNDRPVLVVIDGIKVEGGIIILKKIKGKLRFVIDKAKATDVGIKISSRLLRLANRVIDRRDS